MKSILKKVRSLLSKSLEDITWLFSLVIILKFLSISLVTIELV